MKSSNVSKWAVLFAIVLGLSLTGSVFAQNGDPACEPAGDAIRQCIQQMTQQAEAVRQQLRQQIRDCIEEVAMLCEEGDMEQARIRARQCLQEVNADCTQAMSQIRTQTQECIRQQLQDGACTPEDIEPLILQCRINLRKMVRARIAANQQIGMVANCLHLMAG